MLVCVGIQDVDMKSWRHWVKRQQSCRTPYARCVFHYIGMTARAFFCELLHKHCAMGACVVIKLVLRVPANRS